MICRTRFAPSPTGYLHIGGARTALYCWLEARHRGGEFVLRIEDTDRERSTQGAIDAILEAMEWLGLDYDEGPIYQTERVARYQEVAEQLIANGKAYYAYETREELDAMREAAMARQEKPRYNGAARELGLPYKDDPNRVIRFKNPLEGTVVFDDLIKGRIEIANSELDDMVIFRPDGYPTYNFAVVVDDWDMGITEVIRGDDHINNTPRQINLYEGIGAPVPKFGHMPMILDEQGAKLSKRTGAADVMQYKDAGYLPDALLSYLARLGWSHGDQELFSRQELIELFDVKDCNSKASRLDMAKLGWVNQHFLKTEDVAAIVPHLVYQLQKLGLDVAAGVGKELAPFLGLQVPEALATVDPAKRGKKDGQGIYTWENGRAKKPDVARDYQAPADLEDRLILPLLNEAVACLHEGVVADADLLDAGVIFGTGFAPFRGGPIQHIRAVGADAIVERLKALQQRHGDRFAPRPGWDNPVLREPVV